MLVDPPRLRVELARACADAGLDPAVFVCWIVEAAPPAGVTPIAYLQPAGAVHDDTVLVFRHVGAERAAAFAGIAHRLAVWRAIPGFPDAALGPMVRHEVEHARRWHLSGTAFYEADERLRKHVGADGYAALPTEREANAAAGLFDVVPPHDVVEETFQLLGERVTVGPEPPLTPLDDGPLVYLV